MTSLYKFILKKIAHFQTSHPYLAVLIILAGTVLIYGGVSQVRTVASLEQMMPKDIEEIDAFNDLRDMNLGQDMIGVVIKLDRESTDKNGVFDVMDYRVFEYIVHLENLIESNADIREVYSMSDIIIRANNNSIPTEKEFENLKENPLVKQKLTDFVNNDKSNTIMLATTDIAADDSRMNLLSRKLVKDIESAGRPPGVEIALTGTPLIQQKLGELITKDRTNTQWISTLLVMLITIFVFGSITSAFVPILVVTTSVNWLYGTMGYTNLPISTLAGGVAAMVIGIGIDYAIHLMNKFKYERKGHKGATVEEAIEMAVVDTGTALTATAVTTISAFLAFLLGAMPEMGRFGLLMVIGVSFSLIFTIFGLPALLVIEDKFLYWIKRKVKFGLEKEFMLRTEDESCEVKNEA